MSEVTQIAAVEAALKESHTKLEAFITKANAQIADTGTATTETKAAVEKLASEARELGDRLFAIEQKSGDTGRLEAAKSIGQSFTDSDAYASLKAGNQKTARLNIAAAITNGTGSAQPLVGGDRQAGIISGAARRLTIRDLLPVGQTQSNLIEFARELVYTNSAAPQAGENVAKAESDITFELGTAAVKTIAHWIAASKQVLDDSPMLESYINTRMIYGLMLKEEDQLLNGDGAGSNISGLIANQTAYVGVVATPKADQVREAITAVQLADYQPSGVIMNPSDWESIDLAKGTDDHYQTAGPLSASQQMLWGLPVVVTNTMPAGNFQVGAYNMAAQIWDRQQSAVEISSENSDNFIKNMCTILAEERLALAIYRPASIVGGAFA